MIITLICGSLEHDKRFSGRNTFPLIGRPMVVYPILAARYAQHVDRVFVTTDAPAIARVARHQGVEVIERPPEIVGSEVSLEEVLAHAYQHASSQVAEEIEAIVVLLANGPTVTAEMIDQGIEVLRQDKSLDAVTAVTQHNEFNPLYACTIDTAGLLTSHPGSLANGNDLTDAYFPASILWVLRSSYFAQKIQPVKPNAIINPAVQRIQPLVFAGYGDVDYNWQIPAVEEWLRRRGFSEESSPYDMREARQAALPAGIGGKQSPLSAPAKARRPATQIERRVLITTVPFGAIDRKPLDLLEAEGIEYVINPLNRKLKEAELADLAKDFGVLIAGTEPNTRRVMENAPHLGLISRVGIGLDSVDLLAARELGIQVSYTPDAPAPAVAELTIGLMISLLRGIPLADRNMRNGVWHRIFGRRLAECTIGLIGVGRIGKRVVRHLSGFRPKRILANDLVPDVDFGNEYQLEWTDKETIYREADIISLHVPLTHLTHNLITYKELALMKPTTVLLNTSRGGIINERDLANALRNRQIAGAAIDTFSQEPYSGELTTLENCILTSHMGSMSKDCRFNMELAAVEEAIRFLKGEPLQGLAPESEYELQRRRK